MNYQKEQDKLSQGPSNEEIQKIVNNLKTWQQKEQNQKQNKNKNKEPYELTNDRALMILQWIIQQKTITQFELIESIQIILSKCVKQQNYENSALTTCIYFCMVILMNKQVEKSKYSQTEQQLIRKILNQLEQDQKAFTSKQLILLKEIDKQPSTLHSMILQSTTAILNSIPDVFTNQFGFLQEYTMAKLSDTQENSQQTDYLQLYASSFNLLHNKGSKFNIQTSFTQNLQQTILTLIDLITTCLLFLNPQVKNNELLGKLEVSLVSQTFKQNIIQRIQEQHQTQQQSNKNSNNKNQKFSSYLILFNEYFNPTNKEQNEVYLKYSFKATLFENTIQLSYLMFKELVQLLEDKPIIELFLQKLYSVFGEWFEWNKHLQVLIDRYQDIVKYQIIITNNIRMLNNN